MVQIHKDGDSTSSHIIKDIWKSKNETVWKVNYEIDGKTYFTTIGPGGQASAGPYLDEILSRNSHIKELVKLDTETLQGDTGSTIRTTGAVLYYADLGINAFKQFKKQLEVEKGEVSYQSRSGYVNETLPWDKSTLVVGTLTKVYDGDTIAIKVIDTGDGAPGLKNTEIKVRFAGIQAPEITKSDGSHRKDNYNYSEVFKVGEEDITTVANESKTFTDTALKTNQYVVVNLDTEEDNVLKKDTYGRYIGMVYLSGIKTPRDAYKDQVYVSNLNKTLITTFSKKVDTVPLAIAYGTDNEFRTNFDGVKYDDYSKFDTALWMSTYGPSAPTTTKDDERAKRQKEKETIVNDFYDQYKESFKIHDVQLEKHKSLNGILIEYNTSKEAIAKENGISLEQLENIFVPGAPRADIVLKVPEIIIEDGKVTVNNPKTNFGTNTNPSGVATDNYIQIPAIGRDESLGKHARPKRPDTVRIGDVELTIPPLSIGVNSTATVSKVKTLRSKSSILTKVGSTKTILSLQLFFSDLEDINGEAISGIDGQPYYINGLRPLIAQFKKTPFLPIINDYINEVHDIHSVALVDMAVTTVPGFPQSLSATLTLIKFEVDAYMPQSPFLENTINYPLMRWYYQETMKYRNPYRSYLAPISGKINNDFLFQIANEAVLIERQEANKKLDEMTSMAILDAKIANGETAWGEFKKDAERFKKIKKQQEIYKGIVKDNPKVILDSSDKLWWKEAKDNKVAVQKVYGGEKDPKAHYHAPSEASERKFVIELSSPANQAAFPSKYRTKDNIFAIPEKHAGLENILVGNGEKADREVDAYRESLLEIQATAEATEGDIPLEDWAIDGLILTNLNVMYENTFSLAQVQLMESPSLQYLGGQDPYIQLTFHADGEEAIMSLRNLFKTADEFAQKYRYGITSGYLGFQNQLAALFGVTTVMLENMKVDTIPGLVNSYKVEMILCGFDKTQKRSETLEGFSTAGSMKKDDRHVSQDPLRDDALVFEEHIRYMEVYPDLELPRYEDLNLVMPQLNAGIANFKYPNQNGGVFVDPDFYVSTEWTYRETIREATKRSDMLFMDGEGQMAYSKPTNSQQDMMLYTTEGQSILDQMQQKVSKASIGIENPENATNSNAGVMSYSEAVATGGAGYQGDPTTAGGPADATTFTDQKMSPKSTWTVIQNSWDTVPAYAQWKSAFGGGSEEDYKKWVANLGNPSSQQVYNEIYKWVDHYFKDVYLDDRGTLSQPNMQKYVYASVDDWYACAFNAKAIATGSKERKPVGGLPQSIYNEFGGKVPRERVANYIKSIFDLESGWKQFSNGKKPLKNPTSSAMGMGQIMMSVHASSKNEAIRLIWDWKYNLEFGIKYFRQQYTKAIKKDTIDYSAKALDWAVRAYEQGNVNPPFAKTTYYSNKFLPKWKKYNSTATKNASPYANNDSSVGSSIMMVPVESKKGPTKGSIVELPKTRQELINDMKPYLVNSIPLRAALDKKSEKTIRAKFIEVHGTDVFKDGDLTQGFFDGFLPGIGKKQTINKKNMIEMVVDKKAYAEKFLKDTKVFSDTELQNLWDATMKRLVLEKNYGKHLESGGADKSRSYTPDNELEDLEADKTLSEYEDIMEGIDDRLSHSSTPTEVFEKSFTDMLDYDMHGRLIRAFPSFQLFIIDEGRWMSNYRLWDNFYGFNAIKSIDIHRSRKNAADTAIIEMTNMYSNLSSRRLDADYGEWDFNIWENLILGEPNQELLNARAELVTQMMLKTGARIHLRLGYSSNVANMPTVFNGTITEMDTEDLVTIVAQGDGIELTSVLSADPKDTTDGGIFSTILEPRDVLVKLMASKGNWFKDALNYTTDGKWFTETPTGIYHFGAPGKIPKDLLIPSFALFNPEYGEIAQNIYSYNGGETYSQWLWRSEEKDGGSGFIPNLMKDYESRVEMKLYGKTVWDIAHDLSYCLPDYITAIHSFGNRSTLFFGKPYYEVSYAYDLQFEKDVKTGKVETKIKGEMRKPFAQYHFYNSYGDIISNKIRTSEDGVYTNVIVNYDGKPTDIIHADFDIRYDKQRTAVIEAPIVADFPGANYFRPAKQALYYGCSALRDFMKDMYKGQLVVIGDPSVKPFDYVHIMDDMTTMNGVFQVESVTHHFSMETGFITSITPDVVTVIDDQLMISSIAWLTSTAVGAGAAYRGKIIATSALKKFAGSALGEKTIKSGKWTGRQMLRYASMIPIGDKTVPTYNKALRKFLDGTEKNDAAMIKAGKEEMDKAMKAMKDKVAGMKDGKGKASLKAALSAADDISKGIQSGTATATSVAMGKNVLNKVKILKLATSSNMIALLASAGLSVAANIVQEAYARGKIHKQAIMILPLQYQGREFAAGINGHKGLVMGDPPGKWDNFYMGLGFDGDGEGTSAFVGKMMNVMFDGDFILNTITVTGNAINQDWVSDEEAQRVFRGSINLDRQMTYNDYVGDK